MFGEPFCILFALSTLALGVGAFVPARIGVLKTREPPPGIVYHQVTGTRPSFSSVQDKSAAVQQRLQGTRGTQGNPRSAAAILGAHQRQVGGYGYQNVTSTTAYGTQYATLIIWNDVPVMLLVDTASSDMWVAHQTFHCVDASGNDIPQGACGFGPLYDGDFQYGLVRPAQHMYVRYGDGETVTGPMGYSDITIGNLTIKKQQVCLANTTYWQGNNVTTGVMGLAYPSLTSSYAGTNDDDHDPNNEIEYSPLFQSMVDQGLVPPIFSVAISRNSSGGVIAFGGIPYVTGLDYSAIAYMPILITQLNGIPKTSEEYSFYTIVPDGWKWGLTTNLEEFPFIVDTGTTLCYLPPHLADAINQAFRPVGVYLWMYGAYFTSCTATAPLLAIILNKIPFYINPVDLIFRNLKDPLTGLCMTGIAQGGDGPYILGDVFLQNVLATYDVGKSEMRFTGRQYY